MTSSQQTVPQEQKGSPKCHEFAFRPYDKHPGQSNARKMMLLHNRLQSQHKDFPPWVYKPMFFLFVLFIGFGLVNIVFFLAILFLVFPFAPLPVTISFCAILCYRLYKNWNDRLDDLLKRFDGLSHIFHPKGSLKDEKFYQDVELIKKAYALSPYRLNLYHHAYHIGAISQKEYDLFYHEFVSLNKEAKELYLPVISKLEYGGKKDNNSELMTFSNTKLSTVAYRSDLDMVDQSNAKNTLDNLIFHQPIEGYCFFATIGTMTLSLPSQVKLFATPSRPLPVRLTQVPELLQKLCEAKIPKDQGHEVIEANNDYSDHISKLELFAIDNETVQFAKFASLILQANDVNKRVCVNFLRTPLFNPAPKTRTAKAMAAMSGHWSPCAGCVYDNGQFYALILDVNHTYGSWMVPLDRLFESCWSRDDNGYRGVAVFEIKEDLLKLYNHQQ